jgi:hypothetical protein
LLARGNDELGSDKSDDAKDDLTETTPKHLPAAGAITVKPSLNI